MRVCTLWCAEWASLSQAKEKRYGQGGAGLGGRHILHPALARVQARLPSLIGENSKVEDEYSASRSFKRGATAQARNMEIPREDVIEANNRWRQKERARGSTPHMNLLERSVKGLFEEPSDALNVSTAARSDDAEIDLSLWAVGGEGKHMDKA